MKHFALTFLIAFPLLLLSCDGNKGKLRISGHMEGLDQADFLIYSPDGALEDLDTLHLKKGSFDRTFPVSGGPHEFVIIYPNFKTLSFLASETQHVKINGDAQALSQVLVEGADSILPVEKERPRQRLINGKPLPESEITDLLKDKRGKQKVIIGFWANWRGSGAFLNYDMRQLLEEHHDSLAAISCCMDVDPTLMRLNEKPDPKSKAHWETFCDYRGLQSPLVRQLGIHRIPYYILLDTAGHIITHGPDYPKDIEPRLPKKK